MPPLYCFGCKDVVSGPVEWLGDEHGGQYPFHSSCANAPWPLFPITPFPLGDADALDRVLEEDPARFANLFRSNLPHE